MTTVALDRSWFAVSGRRFVAGVCGAVVLLRLVLLPGPLHTDEAGYYMVAQTWRSGGPYLYGHYFVDRPPLLIGLYRLAVLSGWPQTVRLLATLGAVGLVVSAAWAARQVAGERGVQWAALVAGALVTTPLLVAQEADGEILAAPFVMLGVALTLVAVRRRGWAALGSAVGAGAAAGSAVMVKQNFGDAYVFTVVLLVAGLLQRHIAVRDTVRVAAGGVLGGLLVAIGALAYVAWSGTGFGAAWRAVFAFRGTALGVIADHGLRAPMLRAGSLVVLAAISGVLLLLAVLLVEAVRHRLRGGPVTWALAVTLLFELVSIASGGSYWPHYLIQLTPMLALAAGLWAPTARQVRAAVVFVTASAVAATAVTVLAGASSRNTDTILGTWLQRSRRAGDTATVLYGHAQVLHASGMTSPYQHLWTLPMRTLDPRLAGLRTVLRGPAAPTWVVVTKDLDPWHIDTHGQTQRVLDSNYHQVAQVCGRQVYLHDGVRRRLPPPTCRDGSAVIDLDIRLP